MNPVENVYKHLSCEWTIFAMPNKSIQFEIMYVRIEDSPFCYLYSLTVNDRDIHPYALSACFQLIHNQYHKKLVWLS